MGYPGRQNIYDAIIRRMVQEALELQEQQFRQEHGSDPDEQLLSYLRSCAMNQSKNFVRVRLETERQKKVYRQHKAEKKVLAAKRRAEQEAKRKKSD